MSARRTHRAGRHAFTLVELLVVIGIIVVLLGILLPTVSAVRKAASNASSQAAITNLAGAVDRYKLDFGAYPGLFSNAQITGSTPPPGPGSKPITMSENLLLSLVGGYEVGQSWAAGWDASSTIGKGPISHNPIATARKRVPAYISVTPGDNIQARPWSQPGVSSSIHAYDSKDSDLPEFIDKFPDPLPILYIRARSGAAGNVEANDTEQYNVVQLQPYDRENNTDFADPAEFPSTDLDTSSTVNERYFRDPNVGVATNKATWQPRQKDGFWLIGAGPDRKYGTRDDQTNFGGLR